MHILNLPEGPRLTRFRPPWIVKEKRRKRVSTDPRMSNKKVDKETSQSATMSTDYEVKRH